MTTWAHRPAGGVTRPVRLRALVDEARKRARSRRLLYSALALIAALALGAFYLLHQGGPSGPKVPPNGVASKPALPPDSGQTVHDRFVRFRALRHGWVRGIPRNLRAVSRVVPLDGGRVFVARGGCLWFMFWVGPGPYGGCRAGLPSVRQNPPRLRGSLLV